MKNGIFESLNRLFLLVFSFTLLAISVSIAQKSNDVISKTDFFVKITIKHLLIKYKFNRLIQLQNLTDFSNNLGHFIDFKHEMELIAVFFSFVYI